jgi:plasmid stabilization system protein ParE
VRLILTEAAKADIRQILRTTRAQFGPLQVPRYRALISEARQRLRADPGLGHHRDGLPPEGRVFHISQRGKPASHFLVYAFDASASSVIVVRVLHDAVDIGRHWPAQPR